MGGPESAGDFTGVPDVTELPLDEVVASRDPAIAAGAQALRELLGPEALIEITEWPEDGQ